MATHWDTRRLFRVSHGIFWLMVVAIIGEISGDTVHLISVTTTPYGASSSSGSDFYCILNDPDKDELNNIVSARHVMRGSISPYNTQALPGYSSTTIPVFGYTKTTLSQGIAAQGVYYCEASSRGLTTRVPVTILATNRRFESSDEVFTVTRNTGDVTSISVNIKNTPIGYSTTDIRWEKQGATVEDFQDISRFDGSSTLSFVPVTLDDAGVYATYWRDLRYEFLFSMIRLIVRECPAGRWGAPSCIGICDNCYNGGICDDKTGECVCRPGFSGPNCLSTCGVDQFGFDCTSGCNQLGGPSTCAGVVICMPDPVGCSCAAGYTGSTCQQTCTQSFFGAGCSQDCHCPVGVSCNAFTGQCLSGSTCAGGWSGSNCQIPDVCGPGYYGTTCTDKCNCQQCDKTTGACETSPECLLGFFGSNCETECHCLNGAACDRDSGQCDEDDATGLILCEPGYESTTGVDLANCQHYVGCFDNCAKTCHCAVGTTSVCTETGTCNDGCIAGWGGTMCQTGVVQMSVENKVDVGKPVTIQCAVVWNADTEPTTGQITLYFDSVTSSPTELDVKGTYAVAKFSIQPTGNKVPLTCVYQEIVNGEGLTGFQSLTADYYNPVPLRLSRTPSADAVGTTSVTLSWDAWGTYPEDEGEGTVTAYNVYILTTLSPVASVAVPPVPQNTYSAAIGSLTPNTLYRFYVTVEGPNGEGTPGQFIEITTLSITTQPQPTTKTTTTQSPTTSTPNAPTTKPPTTLKEPTTMTTTSMAADTNPPVGEMTTATGGMSTSSGGVSDERTTKAITQGMTTRSTTTAVGGGRGGSSATNQLIPIIAVIVVAVILILIFIIAVAWFLRKRRNRFKRYPPSIVASEADLDRLSGVFPEPSSPSMIDTRSIASTLDGIDNPALEIDEVTDSPSLGRPKSVPLIVVPDSGTPPSVRARPKSAGLGTQSIKTRLRIPAVNVKDFANYMKAKRQTTDLRVEWESLPKDLARPTTIAKKPENKGKNRYRNVVAYDHSRVVLDPLDTDPNSDYVNACYIKGIKNPKAYIASQGPNEKTLGDMWRIIWQENISIMVMACNLFEEGRPKCAKYWPDKGAPMEFHGMTVELESEKQKEEYYLIRKFKITKEGEEETRKLTQYHYTTWPDKDVPRHCTPVLKFVKDINQHFDRKAPLLLHCSAGAGRTGALIAIHGMMELTEEKGQVDIYNFVFSMRNSRPNIVQTASQYAFVHDAMLEYLFCKNTFTEAGIFADRLKAIQDQNPETGNTYIEDEYEILNLVSPNLVPDKTRGSMKQDNMAKIRSNHSMPVDSSRPYLMTPRGDDDPSPYVNASYMDGYKKKDLFITTQMPMTNTVIDLWRMMYDYNCTSIVQLNDMDEEDKNCPQFWPDAGTNEYGPFTVSLMSKETHPDFEMRHLQLVYTKRDVKSPIPVKHFQYTTWPKDDERPATSEGILQLISAVEKWQKTVEQPGPIVVLCMNACGRSGTFCTIQTCLDQIREEQGVDVLQNVKNLRIHRTNMVDTSAKYLFCYETILDYLKAFDDYTNKKTYQNVPEAQLKKGDGKVPDVLYDEVPSDLKKNATDTKESKEEKGEKDETDSKVASNHGNGEMKSDNNTPVKNAEGENNATKAAVAGEPEAKPSNEDKFKLPPRPKPKPTMKDRKSKGAEGGGTPKESVKERKEVSKKESKKGSKRGSKKQEQLYENIMFDTKL